MPNSFFIWVQTGSKWSQVLVMCNSCLVGMPTRIFCFPCLPILVADSSATFDLKIFQAEIGTTVTPPVLVTHPPSSPPYTLTQLQAKVIYSSHTEQGCRRVQLLNSTGTTADWVFCNGRFHLPLLAKPEDEGDSPHIGA